MNQQAIETHLLAYCMKQIEDLEESIHNAHDRIDKAHDRIDFYREWRDILIEKIDKETEE